MERICQLSRLSVRLVDAGGHGVQNSRSCDKPRQRTSSNQGSERRCQLAYFQRCGRRVSRRRHRGCLVGHQRDYNAIKVSRHKRKSFVQIRTPTLNSAILDQSFEPIIHSLELICDVLDSSRERGQANSSHADRYVREVTRHRRKLLASRGHGCFIDAGVLDRLSHDSVGSSFNLFLLGKSTCGLAELGSQRFVALFPLDVDTDGTQDFSLAALDTDDHSLESFRRVDATDNRQILGSPSKFRSLGQINVGSSELRERRSGLFRSDTLFVQRNLEVVHLRGRVTSILAGHVHDNAEGFKPGSRLEDLATEFGDFPSCKSLGGGLYRIDQVYRRLFKFVSCLLSRIRFVGHLVQSGSGLIEFRGVSLKPKSGDIVVAHGYSLFRKLC